MKGYNEMIPKTQPSNQFQIVGKMDGCTILPMEQADYGRPLIGDVVTQDGRNFYEVRGDYGSRDNGRLWLLAEVPAGVKAVSQ